MSWSARALQERDEAPAQPPQLGHAGGVGLLVAPGLEGPGGQGSRGCDDRGIEGEGKAHLEQIALGHDGFVGIKTGFSPEAVLEQLYRHTPLEDSFHINNVTLVDGGPRTLGLKELQRDRVARVTDDAIPIDTSPLDDALGHAVKIERIRWVL